MMRYGQHKVYLVPGNKISKVLRAKGAIGDHTFAAIDYGGKQREYTGDPVEWTDAEQHRLGSEELRAERRLDGELEKRV